MFSSTISGVITIAMFFGTIAGYIMSTIILKLYKQAIIKGMILNVPDFNANIELSGNSANKLGCISKVYLVNDFWSYKRSLLKNIKLFYKKFYVQFQTLIMKKIHFLITLVFVVLTNLSSDAQSSITDFKKIFTNKNFVIEQSTGSVFTTVIYKQISTCESGYFYMKTSSTQDFGFDQLDSKSISMGTWDIKRFSENIYLQLYDGTQISESLLISVKDNKIFLSGEEVNFSQLNNCYTQLTVSEWKNIFYNRKFSHRIDNGSDKNQDAWLYFTVCENGLINVNRVLSKKVAGENYFQIYSDTYYIGNWDIQIQQGKSYFLWKEKGQEKYNSIQIIVMLNETLFVGTQATTFTENDPGICNDLYQRYQQNQ